MITYLRFCFSPNKAVCPLYDATEIFISQQNVRLK